MSKIANNSMLQDNYKELGADYFEEALSALRPGSFIYAKALVDLIGVAKLSLENFGRDSKSKNLSRTKNALKCFQEIQHASEIANSHFSDIIKAEKMLNKIKRKEQKIS